MKNNHESHKQKSVDEPEDWTPASVVQGGVAI